MKNKFTKQLLIFTLIIVLSNAATYVLTVNGFLNFSSTQFIGVSSRLNTAQVKKLFEAENLINDKFYQKPDENKLLEGAVKGMFAALEDEYSDYYTPEEFARLQYRAMPLILKKGYGIPEEAGLEREGQGSLKKSCASAGPGRKGEENAAVK